MSHDAEPLVSCLCVTENRDAFLPWLRWSFERQTWRNRELVVVSGSDVGDAFVGCDAARIVEVPPNSPIPVKRNVALEHARGDVIAWFDDDDWQHPRRLERLVAALRGGVAIAGWASAWFVDLRGRRCSRHAGSGRVIFNSAGFLATVARSVRFDERVAKASDSPWLRALGDRRTRRTAILPGDDAFCWLSHEINISNPARRRRFPHDLAALRKHVGDAWADTDAQIEALSGRLWPETEPPARIVVTVSQPPTREPEPPRRDREITPVTAFVKACTLDVPFLRVTVPHILKQARYPFAERLLVLDRSGCCEGKYSTRARGSLAELDAVAEDLRAAGVVDRVVEVDETSTREIVGRYFGDGGREVSLRDDAGSPIFVTLYGLEIASHDHVVQFDSDMLFHARGGSWIEVALDMLARDDRIWLTMTHAGPPAGPAGTRASLGPANAGRATWDEGLRIWRFSTASTRYFLTDRRRLRGRLVNLRKRATATAPLEQCISAALRANHAHRACVELEGSWDLHPFSHASPFPEWVEQIAESVERGKFPRRQRGNYDLRLDQPNQRAAWAALLGHESAATPRAPTPRRDEARVVHRSPAAKRSVAAVPGRSPLAIVIPVRDRGGDRFRRCLSALAWQSAGRPLHTVVVSHGSRAGCDAELESFCADFGAELVRVASPSDPWCKPLALNVGIQRTDPALAFVMTLDADMILAPNFVELVLGSLRARPDRFVMCRSTDLPERALPFDAELLARFQSLRRLGRLRGFHGTGGIQAARRSFFFDVRGYDEDFVWWGAEDGDMLTRAKLAGLEPHWICDSTAMLHQWHPAVARTMKAAREREEAAAACKRNHALAADRARVLVRNALGWGAHRT